MFGWEFPPHISGGLGTACAGMTGALSLLGIEVTFVLPRRLKEHVQDGVVILGVDRLAGAPHLPLCRVMAVDSPLRPYADASARAADAGACLDAAPDGAASPPPYGGDLFAEVNRYALVAARLAREGRYDVIHAHEWLTFPAGLAAKEASGLPLVVHVHATEFDRAPDNPDPRIFEVEKLGMERADRVIAVSGRTRDTITARFHIPADKVEVVHNAVTRTLPAAKPFRSRPYPKDRIVLFLGRITKQKGPDTFLEAANLVLQRLPDVRFVMAGSGDMLPSLLERMADLRLLDRFHFTGFLDGQRREEMFRMSDLFVLPSVSEPFGITPLEAMGHGVPVIVSTATGMTEVAPHVPQVEAGDVEGLAARIVELLEDKALRRRLRRADAKALAKVDWRHPAGKVKGLYEQLGKRRIKPAPTPIRRRSPRG